MPTRLRLAACVFLLVSPLTLASAQEPDVTRAVPTCDGKFGLCRYVDRVTGQELVPARFERAMRFSEGLAAVRIDGRFGYIDGRGEVVIAPQFDLAGDFYQGLAEVLVGNRTGIINHKGEIVVPPMFQRAIPFTKEVILAVEGTWTSGYYELPNLKEAVYGPGPFGLYHVAGRWVRRPDLRQIGAFEREGRGLIWAMEKDSKTRQFGLLASDGRWVVEPQYDYGAALTEERAIVRKRVGGALLTGALDPQGQLVIPLQPWGLFYWINGWGMARESYRDGKYALVDKNGAIIGGRWFDKVERGEEGDVARVLIDGRWVGLDRAGNIVPNPRNGRVTATCPSGIRVVEIDGRAQITDANGQPTVPYLLEPLVQRPDCERPFSVSLNGKWGFVGLDGRLLFDPPRFDTQYGFDAGYAAVKQVGKWGIIDTTGRFVLEPTFDQFLMHRAGLFQVELSGRKLWITATGEERPEPPDTYMAPPEMLECGHGLKLVEREGHWGIAEADGRDVIAPRYRALVCFKQGIAWAPIDNRRQWCPVGPDGAVRERPACKTTHYPYLVSHFYPEVLHQDPFESSVLWTRAYLEWGTGKRAVPPRMLPERGGRGG